LLLVHLVCRHPRLPIETVRGSRSATPDGGADYQSDEC
jgi:hypothetical protein